MPLPNKTKQSHVLLMAIYINGYSRICLLLKELDIVLNGKEEILSSLEFFIAIQQKFLAANISP